jgi:hypothetical protein
MRSVAMITTRVTAIDRTTSIGTPAVISPTQEKRPDAHGSTEDEAKQERRLDPIHLSPLLAAAIRDADASHEDRAVDRLAGQCAHRGAGPS